MDKARLPLSHVDTNYLLCPMFCIPMHLVRITGVYTLLGNGALGL